MNKDEVINFFQKNLIEEKTLIEEKPNRIYLAVAYNERLDVKNKGAKFDWERKLWYIYDSNIYKSYLITNYGHII